MGLLGPIILRVTKLMQDVWKCKLQWKESVSQSILSVVGWNSRIN